MQVIELTYRSLLADVSRLTGFSEIRGSEICLHWCIYDAPKLEKYVLECIENQVQPDLDLVPVRLRRLVAASVLDAHYLRLLRQLLLFCYKAHVQHDKATTEASLKQFAETNRLVGRFGNSFSEGGPKLLAKTKSLVQSVLSAFQGREIIPFHGPGSTTTPKGVDWSKWYEQIEHVYPYSDYFSLYYVQDSCPDTALLTDEHIVADVIAVPKDSRGPRLICVHPAESIWIQQGLRVSLERVISLHRFRRGPWPQGHVHFDDQSVNGRIALLSSRSRRYATLDMKEASDRISDVLVQILFGSKYKYFGCCRAQKYHVRDASFGIPDDDIHSYAPMGNATTFPVQSLVFWAICCSSMQSRGFHQPNSVFVFGDDIIVPTECAQFVIDDLESFGLLVNRTKSFWRGGFRESCGVDAFNGLDVTPVRWKTTLDAEHLSDCQSLSDIAMRLRIAGYEEAACTTYATLRQRLKRFTRFPLACTDNRNHGGIAEYVERSSEAWRDAYWHRDTQQFVSPVMRLGGSPSKKSTLHGRIHVLESVCSLERTGRSNVLDRRVSRRVCLDRGWIPMA